MVKMGSTTGAFVKLSNICEFLLVVYESFNSSGHNFGISHDNQYDSQKGVDNRRCTSSDNIMYPSIKSSGGQDTWSSCSRSNFQVRRFDQGWPKRGWGWLSLLWCRWIPKTG